MSNVLFGWDVDYYKMKLSALTELNKQAANVCRIAILQRTPPSPAHELGVSAETLERAMEHALDEYKIAKKSFDLFQLEPQNASLEAYIKYCNKERIAELNGKIQGAPVKKGPSK